MEVSDLVISFALQFKTNPILTKNLIMALKYTHFSFCFSTSAAEIAGLAEKLISFSELAVNDKTADILKQLAKDNKDLVKAIKRFEDAFIIKELKSLLLLMKDDMQAIYKIASGFLKARNENLKVSARDVYSRMDAPSKIFRGKINSQLGLASGYLTALGEAEEQLDLLQLGDTFKHMKDAVADYNKKYAKKIKGLISNKSKSMTDAAKLVIADIKALGSTIRAFQVVGPCEDALVEALLPVWQEARRSQLLSSSLKARSVKKGGTSIDIKTDDIVEDGNKVGA